MTVKYVGTTSARQGEFFICENVPQNALMRRTGETTRIQDLMTYAGTTCRTPSTELEIKWRPGIESEFPRKVGQQAFSALAAGLEDASADAPFVLGVPTSETTKQVNTSMPGEPTGFGFAYSGMSASTSVDVYVELTKIVQLRYSPLQGVVESRPAYVGGLESSAEAERALDDKLGDSWTVDYDAINRGVSGVTEAVLGGASVLAHAAASVNTVRQFMTTPMRSATRRLGG
jgi:hypothetical protein